MLFNSVEFALFLPIVFGVFWMLERRSFRWGNAWLLLASLFFYGWWDWRFLGLVLFSGLLDFVAALGIARATSRIGRRTWMLMSLVGNLGVLGFFKYYDFFITSFAEAFTMLGLPMHAKSLHIVLPVGISFYTFQSLSYTIDVMRGQLRPTKDPVAFGAYLMFFPQLVAGPIERGTELLPQFQRARSFAEKSAADGLRQILWGLFKKVVVADQCASVVDVVFSDYASRHSGELALGAVLFAFQIYGDFSGYSDIAIGCARLFGITLMRNFAYPYFSRDIAEFWRRWHISLNTWFRDYLYIPLGGSRGTSASKARNIAVIFLVSGLWHGANWTFIAWGAINAAFFLPIMLSGRNRSNLGIVAENRVLPSLREALGMCATFSIAVVAFIFFRSDTIGDAIGFLEGILTRPGAGSELMTNTLLAGLSVMLVTEWLQRRQQHGLAIEALPRPVRWAVYLPLALAVSGLSGEAVSFIYFQF